MTKNPRQKLKHLESEKSFSDEIKKIFFIIFKELSFARNFLRPESKPLKHPNPKTWKIMQEIRQEVVIKCLLMSIRLGWLLTLCLMAQLHVLYRLPNPEGIKYLTRLRVSFSHLHDHKLKHSFQDTINRLCTCSL